MNVRFPTAYRYAVMGFAAAITVASASSVIAATKKQVPTAETCKSLEEQVDAAIASHPKASKLATASKHKDEGTRLCSDGNYKEGSKHLHAALKALGVKAVN
ncbi:MAG TPA: hypothetical protein VMH34_05365 [Gammaproteobacteria bacterium]|nr:hypothetical protein [Gammaproteobacteria bacterium]